MPATDWDARTTAATLSSATPSCPDWKPTAACAKTGEAAEAPTLWDDDTLLGTILGHLKTNSHGEFVFDHAWANACARHGRDYYPKWKSRSLLAT
ncbi:peptidogalycan biosysnthesis protein [Stenotrophomonas sp. S41]|uniref:peptidogalycan biosysnthesis protein n=1 Tax=Stenotrophomonas sp. S41 TaxID=2767464 RepID=UPI002D804B9C|nr:peptidogalycan biosysnthesis protein [Stenotrophomonas sp. S41]